MKSTDRYTIVFDAIIFPIAGNTSVDVTLKSNGTSSSKFILKKIHAVLRLNNSVSGAQSARACIVNFFQGVSLGAPYKAVLTPPASPGSMGPLVSLDPQNPTVDLNFVIGIDDIGFQLALADPSTSGFDTLEASGFLEIEELC